MKIRLILLILVLIYFITPSVSAFDTSNWSYYKIITPNQTMINQSIGDVHYTMLINITSDADLASKAQADADDIIFLTSDNTTQIKHQISLFNSSTGALQAYINVTDISNVTSVNMYYGNAGATNTENPTGVWGVNASGIWLMDEGTGLYANDSSGNNNNGTLVNGTAWGNGGLKFDGNNDYVDCGNDNSLNITDAITISIQIQPDFSETASKNYILVDKVIADGSLDAYRLMYNTVENDFRFRITASAPVNCDTNGLTWAAGTKHHIVGTYDGAHMRIFWDGIENNSEIQTGCMTTTDLDLHIGVIAGAVAGYHFDGGINYVHIYNRALSPEEIATQYNNTKSPELFINVSAEHENIEVGSVDITYYNLNYSNLTANVLINISNKTGVLNYINLTHIGNLSSEYCLHYPNGTSVQSCVTCIGEGDTVWFNGSADRLPELNGYYINETLGESTMTISADSWGMFNNWTSQTTFAGIAANESNDVCYTYYNVTSGLWESYYVGYSWNGDYQLSKDASVIGYFNAQTDITSNIITLSSTELYTGWNMLGIQSSSNQTISGIITNIGANCSDSWYFNSSTGSYSNTTTNSIQPNQGFLAYITQNMTWTRSTM